MKKPENIELLLIDYAEGNLDPKDLAIVEAWLENHPEDLELVMEWDNFKLEPDLKAETSSFDNLFVDEEIEEDLFLEIEGQLEPEAQERLLKELKASTPLQREHRLFQLTRLDYERDKLSYPNKEKLKKKGTPVVSLFSSSWIQYAAAAAFVGLMIWFNLSPEATMQYAFRDINSYPQKLELNEIDLELPVLPSLLTENYVAESSSSNKSKLTSPNKIRGERDQNISPMQPINRSIELGISEPMPLLAYNPIQIPTQNSSAPKTGSILKFDNLYAFARHKILKRLSPGLENESNTDVLVKGIERLSEGKMSIKVEDGKVLALQTPLVDWKRSQ